MSKQRTSSDAMKNGEWSALSLTELESRTADPETALEVDVMVLDFLAAQAIEQCFTYRAPATIDAVVTFDAFLIKFKRLHSDCFDARLRLRIKLLQLLSLFVTRHNLNALTPPKGKLDQLRQRNAIRARNWIKDEERLPSLRKDIEFLDTRFPISSSSVHMHRARFIQATGVLDCSQEKARLLSEFHGAAESISLLDLLPIFMSASAACKMVNNGKVEELWMELAGEFMLQACLEQYLARGAWGTDPIDEAFAWGYVNEIDVSRTNDAVMINNMFEDATYEAEIEGWQDTKDHFLDKLLPKPFYAKTDPPSLVGQPPSSEGLRDLEIVAMAYPFAAFNSKLLLFLEALSASIGQPVLMQLASEHLEGMTIEQSRKFLLNTCKIDPRALPSSIAP